MKTIGSCRQFLLTSAVTCLLGIVPLGADITAMQSASLIEQAVSLLQPGHDVHGKFLVGNHGFYEVDRRENSPILDPASPVAVKQSSEESSGEIAQELKPVDGLVLPESLDDHQMANFADLCNKKIPNSCNRCRKSCQTCETGSDQCSQAKTCASDTCETDSCSNNTCETDSCSNSCEVELVCEEEGWAESDWGDDFFGASSGLLTTGGGGGSGSGFFGSGGGGGSGSGSGSGSGTGSGTGTATGTGSTTGPAVTTTGVTTGPAVTTTGVTTGPAVTTTATGVVVPEPTTWLALGTMAAIALYLKRRREKAL